MILGYIKYRIIYRMRFVCMFEVEKFSKDKEMKISFNMTYMQNKAIFLTQHEKSNMQQILCTHLSVKTLCKEKHIKCKIHMMANSWQPRP